MAEKSKAKAKAKKAVGARGASGKRAVRRPRTSTEASPEAHRDSDPEAGLPEGMAGRRTFLEHLERRFAGAVDTAQPLTLLILAAHRKKKTRNECAPNQSKTQNHRPRLTRPRLRRQSYLT